MAFLDNSGDIILDAVLTDLGRKRMAEGTFTITQFSLGDDEIDYSLYNKSHPSGSAYFDLEILQTPIFEAFTRENSNINYGLLTLDGAQDVFYLPRLVLNQNRNTGIGNSTTLLTNGVAYLAVNPQTRNTLDAAGLKNLAQSDVVNDYFLFETGIDNNNDPAGTLKQRSEYLLKPRLIDNQIELTCDKRFINAVYGISRDGEGNQFVYQQGDNAPNISMTPLRSRAIQAVAASTSQKDYDNFRLPTVENKVVDQVAGSGTPATSVSAINGPRGIATSFVLGVPQELKNESTGPTPTKFTLYGRTNVPHTDPALAGIGSGTYDFLDTVLYLKGNTTGANTQLIIRIIRQAA